MSAHPLDNYMAEWKSGIGLSLLGETFDQQTIDTVGLLSNVIHRTTKKNRPFSMADLEDFDRKITVLLFDGPHYSQLKLNLTDHMIVKLKGKVKIRQGDVSLMIESITPVETSLAPRICHVDILDDTDLEDLNQIKQTCLLNRGQIPLYFHVHDKIIKSHKKYWIKDSALTAIESIIGEQKVWLETSNS
jgi:DNA polymerase III alpha subunit